MESLIYIHLFNPYFIINYSFRMFLPAILFLIILMLFFYLGSRKPKGLPPGPRWWPILGSTLEVIRLRKQTGYLYKTLSVLSKKYGPVFAVKIGIDTIVFLNDYNSIRSMLTNEDCDGRPTGHFYKMRTQGKSQGVLVTDGRLWVEQRRFVLRHLREFGFGRTTMASLIEEEAQHLVNHFKRLLLSANNPVSESRQQIKSCSNNNGQIYQLISDTNINNTMMTHEKDNIESDTKKRKNEGMTIEDAYVKADDYDEVRKISQSSGMIISMHDAFGIPVLNTLWRMMTGKRYNPDDAELKYLQKIATQLLKDVDMVGSTFSYFPILRYLAPEMSGYKSFVATHERIWRFLKKELENHKTNINPEKPKDLMDAYINILQTESYSKTFSEQQLLAICLDLFMAGSETTSKALSFGFLYIVLNPDVQRKAQEEIDLIIGHKQFPRLSDRVRMPYNDAIVLESVRMFMGRTMGIPHRALRDTYITGYRIPKNTMIVPNFNGVLMNNFWKDPEVFRPERFINSDGKISIPDQYLPFSFGKHRCMGEGLAKSNIFVITTTLLQTFRFSVVPGDKKPSTEIVDGVTAGPKPFRVLVTPRI
ncbi:probable cytochrome P450 303a1 [Cephus cinctus]|uniref:Probable cytochrome P450 303a1 n=1 Tax=Cephus cinctus TaxID=211228 RepID=A0AAJ7FPZ7_CEPCN|nr:probable cytochrome P450 303a1 [Cephus cinctus]